MDDNQGVQILSNHKEGRPRQALALNFYRVGLVGGVSQHSRAIKSNKLSKLPAATSAALV